MRGRTIRRTYEFNLMLNEAIRYANRIHCEQGWRKEFVFNSFKQFKVFLFIWKLHHISNATTIFKA